MYDPYNENVTDDWTFAAQVAIWRERAIHNAERAARWQRIAEAAATVPVKVQEPAQ
ncbi:hypothetical protein [Pseudarthrobacter siccitolerans]